MKYLRVLLTAVLLIPISIPFAQAQTPKSDPVKTDPRFFPLDEIKPGMKGVARTIFQGDKPEEFGFEVLGLLDGFPNPKEKIVIMKLTGTLSDRTGIFQGMSGSPAYIDGKLVGAVAYGFPFSKEPIGGITPIQQMVDIFRDNSPAPPKTAQVHKKYSFSDLSVAASTTTTQLPAPMIPSTTIGTEYGAVPSMAPYIGQTLKPIATPLSFSGITQEALQQFWPQLQSYGLVPLASNSGTAKITPLAPSTKDTLAPGTSISVQLVRGDYAIDAQGTVTWRDGDKIYAFGHPFLGIGSSEMPMSEADVITVVPSLSNSFKLGRATNLVGTISQDRATGVYGKLGQAPKMIPITINVTTSNKAVETYHYEVMSDSFLTPLLMNITMMSSITKTERGLGDSTIESKGKISLRGQSPVMIESRYSGRSIAPGMTTLATTRPLDLLMNSGFKDLDIENIEVDVLSSDGKNTGSLDRLWVDKTEVKRGQKIELQAFARDDEGKEFVQRIPIEIPRDVPAGKLSILVGDGSTMDTIEQRLIQSPLVNPQDTADLVQALNKRRKNDRLYVMLLRSDDGAIINNQELPSLPPSVLATLNSSRTSGGFTPVSLSAQLEIELPAAKFVISGQRVITIDVIR